MSVPALPAVDRLDGFVPDISDEDVVDAWLQELAGTYRSTLLDRLLDDPELPAALAPVISTIDSHRQLAELNAGLDAARARRFAVVATDRTGSR